MRSRLFFINPAPENRKKALVQLNPLAKFSLRKNIKERLADLDGKKAFSFEDFCGDVLATSNDILTFSHPGTHDKTYEEIKALPPTRKDNSNTIVKAFTNFPLIDYAVSQRDWINARVGQNSPKINAGAFVTTIIKFGYVTKSSDKKRLERTETAPTEVDKISLTMLRNVSPRNKNLKANDVLIDSFGDNHKDLAFDHVCEIFDQFINCKCIDISDLIEQETAWVGKALKELGLDPKLQQSE